MTQEDALGALDTTIPLYACPFVRRTRRGRLGLILLAVTATAGLVVNDLLGVAKHLPWTTAQWLLIVYILGFGLWGLNFVRARTVALASEFVTRSASADFYAKLVGSIRLMYRNRFVIPFALAFGFLVLYRFWLFNFPVPLNLKLYFSLFALITGTMAGLGLWCAISSITFVLAFRRCDSLRFFPLSPNRSYDIVRLSALMNKYALIFAFEIVPFVFGFIIISQQLVAKDAVSPDTLRTSTYIVVIFLVIVIPIYFLIPQAILAQVVGSRRRELVQEYQHKISGLLAIGSPEARSEALALVPIEDRIDSSGSLPARYRELIRPVIPLIASALVLVIKNVDAAKHVAAIAAEAIHQLFPGLPVAP